MASDEPVSEALVASAIQHTRDILSIVVEHTDAKRAVIVSDSRSPLARLLTRVYCACLPAATHLVFDDVAPDAILQVFNSLAPGDLVVLIESSSFQLVAFRIRVELFNRGQKVIEHPHLEAMLDDEISNYVASLAYDASYYRGVGQNLKRRIDCAQSAEIESGGETLVYSTPFQPAKLNTGDYSETRHVGGQFPIGEVFTEALDLERVNGRVRIFAFADTDFRVNAPDRPITLEIERGRILRVFESTPAFDRVFAQIIELEGEVLIRELGFGMNRAFDRDRRVSDVGTYERQLGIHISLGRKHNVYRKPQFHRKALGHHVDVFAVTECVRLDGEVVFREGAWVL